MGGRPGQGPGAAAGSGHGGVHQPDAGELDGVARRAGQRAEQAGVAVPLHGQAVDFVAAAVIGGQVFVVDGDEAVFHRLPVLVGGGGQVGVLHRGGDGVPHAGDGGLQVLQVAEVLDVGGVLRGLQGEEAVVPPAAGGAVHLKGGAGIGHVGLDGDRAPQAVLDLQQVFEGEGVSLQAQGVVQHPGAGVHEVGPLGIHAPIIQGAVLQGQADGLAAAGEGDLQLDVVVLPLENEQPGDAVGDLHPQGIFIIEGDGGRRQGDGGAALRGQASVIADHGAVVHPGGAGGHPPEVEKGFEILVISHRQGLPGEEHVDDAGALRLVDDVEVPVPQGGLDGLRREQVAYVLVLAVDVVDGDLPVLPGVGGQGHVVDAVVRPDHQGLQPLAALEEDGPVLGRHVDLPGGGVHLRQPGVLPIGQHPHHGDRQQDHQHRNDQQRLHQREAAPVFVKSVFHDHHHRGERSRAAQKRGRA